MRLVLALAGLVLMAADPAPSPVPAEGPANPDRNKALEAEWAKIIPPEISARVFRLAERLASGREVDEEAAAAETASLKDARARPILRRLLGSPNPLVVRFALQGLGLLRDPADAETIAPFLAATSPDTRIVAVRALALSAGAAAAPKSRALLRDSSDKVRFEAVQRLAVFPDREGLQDALGDRAESIRALSASALVAVGDRRAAAFAAADPSPSVRRSLAGSLARSRAVWAIPILIPFLEDADAGVRLQGASALFECARMDLGFQVDLAARGRAELRARWEAWWKKTGEKIPEPARSPADPASPAEHVLLTRAGETLAPDRFRLATGETVRLVGLVAPPAGSPEAAAGMEALRTILAEKTLLLAARPAGSGLEGWCWAESKIVQEEVLRAGGAKRSEPEIPAALAARCKAAEDEARAAKRGVWK
ncbi:MAG: HEAT repeat domain-containing protein [Planctomycetota bacterium]